MKILNPLRRLWHKVSHNRIECNLCGYNGESFIPLSDRWMKPVHVYGKERWHDEMETVNVENFTCPGCRGDDKTRLYGLFLERYFQNHGGIDFLHVAPERMIVEKFVKGNKKIQRYLSVDLNSKTADVNADIRDLSFLDTDSFDLIMCSHVLEHIPKDYEKAIAELFRVLKPGGSAIIMVPTLISVKPNYEEDWINTPELRQKHYGLDDHFRFFTSHGLLSDLTEQGFNVEKLGYQHFGKDTFKKHGINENSWLYLCSK